MHSKNIHQGLYDFDKLIRLIPELEPLIITNKGGNKSINFDDYSAVVLLNKGLLKLHYGIDYWEVPNGALCPPIPSRLDYLLHLQDLLDGKKLVKGLDVGTGASSIYPLLASAFLKWKMVGSDIHEESIDYAKRNTNSYSDFIEIRHQFDKSKIFTNIIGKDEFFDLTMCNPPFYQSKEEAQKLNAKKNNKLNLSTKKRNFGGWSNELWCNGGEFLFVKRMIKESRLFKHNVGWFTSLISNGAHIDKLTKLTRKYGAKCKVVPMEQGQKKSRFIAWRYPNS